ncbi:MULTISPECIES: type I 3-dehydroquinate dehydratase [Helcobacillus]|uniref:3-dehydroquinate dehydratase n=1 Tax=Helcobacillus massiliensis TaxID=521392 RepID=A0A839QWI3_9MICO|nr:MULTISPECIES: type I 3-dehydroquinate dehydratase [Helcobacillus]MBB3022351.1 3-dehydroquinate dehydratase-1 [Helcobacillus massiliensis]MCG7426429.1 type I 3-dehydroquinate dehydratase [Helcobacillus sp. ACRRO]
MLPQVIVPIMPAGPTAAAAAAAAADQASAAVAAGADVIEWRVDALGEAALDPAVRAEAADAISRALAAHADPAAQAGAASHPGRTLQARRVPLLAAVRTVAEGDGIALGDDAYADLLLDLAARSGIDAIDVEAARLDPASARDLVTGIAQTGAAVIGSSHDFRRTPSAPEIHALLDALHAAGCRTLKIAVMPTSRADVLTLMQAVESYQSAQPAPSRKPVIAMSMGPLGAVTRIAPQAFASAATFAAVGRASAPGQIPIDQVRAALPLSGELPGSAAAVVLRA